MSWWLLAAPSWADASNVQVQLSPSNIAADGTSTSTAKATVTDASNNPVTGDTVAFSSSDSGQGIGPVTNNGDGTYTATITSSTTPGQATITATDQSAPASQPGQATLTQHGPAAQIGLVLQPSSIVADGASTSTAKATVADSTGNGVPGEQVSFASSDAGDQFGSVTDHGDGTYTVTVTSSKTAGTPTITASDPSVTVPGQATLTQTPGPASQIGLVLQPSAIVANGTSTSTAKATVKDANGNGVPGEQVSFASSDAGDQFGSVTDHGDGTYTATVTSSTTVGTPTVTATDSSANISGQSTLTQTAGPATQVTVVLQPGSIVANGTSTSTATATVTDANGHRVPGDNVSFSSTDAGEHFGSVTDHGDGTYTATVTSSTTVGTPTITATDNSASIFGQSTLTQTAGPATHVTVVLQPGSIVADGTSTSTATATVTDATGHRVPGDNVSFSSTDAGERFGSVTDHGDGTYTATVTSSTTAGAPTITATDSSANISGQSTLTQTAGPAKQVTVVLQPGSIVANGTSTSTAKATVTDVNGNAVAGHSVSVSSTDAGEHVGSVTDHGDGTYTATVTSSTTVGTPTITATDHTVNISGQATLTQTPGPATQISLVLQPGSIIADGTSTSTAKATVKDVNGNALAGHSVSFSSSDAGERLGSVTDHGDGTYTVTVTSSKTAGTPTITATDNTGNVSGQATLTQTPGPATQIGLVLQPSSIVANGTSTSNAKATVKDVNGNPVAGQSVSFSSTDAGEHVGSVTDHGDGTYTTTVTSSTTVGTPTITATDNSASIFGQSVLTQTPGPATHVTVVLQPGSIVADGTSTSTAKATVTDANGHRVPGDNVSFSSTDAGEHFGSVTDHGDGTYTATLTSSTTAGTPTITATDGTTNISGQSGLTQTPGPATHISVALQPGSIVANGTSTSTATATVTDANGNAVAGRTVKFSSTDASEHFGSVTDNGDGTYSATLTSSKVAGTPTITATDHTANISGQATLTQTAGPAKHITLTVRPNSIVANGVSNSTATATVTDANQNLVTGDTVSFTSSDAGEKIQTFANQPAGTYAAEITSSMTVGTATITATDSTAGISAQSTLTQINSPSSTSLTASPSPAATNQAVTLFAAITSGGSPSGTITFQNGGTPIPGCTSEPVSPSGTTATATCSTSFAAATSPAQLTAVFAPDAAATVSGSTGAASLAVTRGPTVTSLGESRPTVSVGETVTYSAFVIPSQQGHFNPSGTVRFLDGAQSIGQCANQPLASFAASAVASCTVGYSRAGSHTITAVYDGDGNFTGSSSAPTTVPVQFLGTLGATVHWSFASTPRYTSVLAFAVGGASPGSTVLVTCHGGGCPFTKNTALVTKTKRCGPKGKRTCQTHGILDLTPRFGKHHLHPGARISVNISLPGWIGRYYTFVVRASHPPRMQTACLAPGTSSPGGC